MPSARTLFIRKIFAGHLTLLLQLLVGTNFSEISDDIIIDKNSTHQIVLNSLEISRKH